MFCIGGRGLYRYGVRRCIGIETRPLFVAWRLRGHRARSGRSRRRGLILVVRVLEQAVDEEREPHDHEETADADPLGHGAPGDANQHHEPEADAHQRHAGTAVPAGRTVAVALEDVHRPVEASGIDFGGRHQAPLDQRDSLAHLEFTDSRFAHGEHDDVRERADRADDRDQKGPRQLQVVQLRLQGTRLN